MNDRVWQIFCNFAQILILSAYEYRKDKGQVVQDLHYGG